MDQERTRRGGFLTTENTPRNDNQTSERTRATYKILDAIKSRNGTIQQLDRIEVPATWPEPFEPLTATTSIEDPKNCENWTLITDPSEIEYYLLLRIRRHFGQAHALYDPTSEPRL